MRVLIASVILLLCACGRAEQGYPPEYEFNFMHACEANSSVVGYCACVWDKIEANISPRDFRALEMTPAAARVDNLVQRQIDAYARTCPAPAAPAP